MSRVDLSTYTSAGADEATYLTDNTKYRTLACKAATSALDRTTESGLPLGKVAYRYKDYGAGYFEDFTHYIDYCVEDMASTSTGQVFPWMLANKVGSGERAVTAPAAIQVAASTNDASCYYTGAAWTLTNDVSCGVGYVSTTVYKYGSGYRFALAIPKDAKIISAKLSFKCRAYLSNSNTVVSACICGELADNGLEFSDVDDFKARRDSVGWGGDESTVTDHVHWTNIAAWTAGTWYDSPDISSIVQTKVSQATWESGDYIVLFAGDHGCATNGNNPLGDQEANHYRLADTYDTAGNVSGVKLTVTYVPATDFCLALNQVGDTLSLAEFYGSTVYSNSALHHHMTEGELLYPKIERAGTTVYAHLYHDPAHTIEYATAIGDDVDSPLVLTTQAHVHYRYCYVANSYNSGSGSGIIFWTGNLWISGTPPASFGEQNVSFILEPDALGTETFETDLSDGETISGSGELTWTVGGTVIATDGNTAGESVSPQGGMSARIACAAGLSYASFDLPGTDISEFQMMGWFNANSVNTNSDAQLFSVSEATPKIVGAALQDVSGTLYWRIWKYAPSTWVKSTQAVFTATEGMWYQVLLFQDYYNQLSLWVRAARESEDAVTHVHPGEQYYEWTEVEAAAGYAVDWTNGTIGSHTGTPTSVVQVDDIRFQRGVRTISQIARGGTNDAAVLVTSFLNKNGTYTGETYSTISVSGDPSCWTKRHDLGPGAGLNTGFLVWDSTNSCWWEFETVDNVCDVYQIDADWTRTLRAHYDSATVDAPGVNNGNLAYVIPSRLLEAGYILCTLIIVDGTAEEAVTADVYFIKFNANYAFDLSPHEDTTTACWSTPVLICDETDGVNLNAQGDDFFPTEAFLWRQPSGGELVCIVRLTHLGDDPDHGAAAAHQYQRIFNGGANGSSWDAGAWPGGDSGMGMDCYSGWLNAFVFRGHLFYQGYNARTACSLNVNKNFKTVIALAGGEDGALITERHWGWGPEYLWNKGFAFYAANGNVDASDYQSGEFYLSCVFQRGIGWYMEVGTGLSVFTNIRRIDVIGQAHIMSLDAMTSMEKVDVLT